MPQNPVESTLFVSKLVAGSGIALDPDNGTGIVTVSIDGVEEAPIPQQVYHAVSTAPTTNNLNLTGANISGGSILTVLNLTAVLAAGATATLPTVAQLVAAMETAGITPVAGSSYELDMINSSTGDFAWTVTTNTGWTLTGTLTVAQYTLRRFILTFTSLSAATLQSIGTYSVGTPTV
jgi:hypothetical protein